MIKATALSKSFRRQGSRKDRVQAVSDVSFEAGNGQITGLLGPNGAGKSTTLRILATLIQPDNGSAEIDGFDVTEAPQAVRRQIGFLPHNSGLYPRLTARENIAYYAELCGLDARQSRMKTGELIERLSMRGFADRRAEGFSQGQRTKVALGRALIHEPSTLILDEPTNGLDVMATRQLRSILRQLRDEGHCILLSSHIMQEVSMLCDHVAIISDGRVALADSIDGIRERTGQADLEDAFVVAIGGRLEATE
ncbi:ABC transporter ATP-binding protein [Saccharospirillum salsuginis]|uniref:ABC transporter ATP-binding protein n=1 Tax=Saccharospirillum salsuginis TaxID=418750 RepID=A0A918N5K8_9GAMM|nr:ATP-binding cassette domain-containing protein [Saccharospirillum salsuginis]GGX39377.1 ABC transporter ATP-binding protein [Saccharospirillum salsuginis]